MRCGLKSREIRQAGDGSAQIIGNRARSAKPARFAMQPNGRACRLEPRHPLREEPGEDPRQHIAGTRGGECRRGAPVDHKALVRRGDQTLMSLEDDDRAAGFGSRNGTRFAASRQIREKRGEFPFMRRQENGARQRADDARETGKVRAKAAQRIRIQHNGGACFKRGENAGAGFSVHACAGAEAERPEARIVDQPLPRFSRTRRFDHHAGDMRGLNAQRRLISRQRYDTRADAQGAKRGKTRGAGGEFVSAEDKRCPARVFMILRMALRQR